MYSFSYYGILCLLKEAYYHKHYTYRVPSNIKNEFNRIVELKTGVPKEHWKSPERGIIEKEKNDERTELIFTSIKNFLKIAKRQANSSN